MLNSITIHKKHCIQKLDPNHTIGQIISSKNKDHYIPHDIPLLVNSKLNSPGPRSLPSLAPYLIPIECFLGTVDGGFHHLGIGLAGVDSTLVPVDKWTLCPPVSPLSAVSVSWTSSLIRMQNVSPYKGFRFMHLDAWSQLNLHPFRLQTASALRTEGICGGGATRTGGLLKYTTAGHWHYLDSLLELLSLTHPVHRPHS